MPLPVGRDLELCHTAKHLNHLDALGPLKAEFDIRPLHHVRAGLNSEPRFLQAPEQGGGGDTSGNPDKVLRHYRFLNRAAVQKRTQPTEIDDEAIVERVIGGDTSLFEVLMRRHNQRLYRIIRVVLRREDEVEDVMQQAYMNAFGHLAQFKSFASAAVGFDWPTTASALARVPSSTQDPKRATATSELRGLLEQATTCRHPIA